MSLGAIVVGSSVAETLGAALAGICVVATLVLLVGNEVLDLRTRIAIGGVCALVLTVVFTAASWGAADERTVVDTGETLVDWRGLHVNPDQIEAGKSFREARMAGAVLDGLSLRGLDFAGAVAPGASFNGSDLQGTTWENADLRGADLRGADLRGACLAGADLTGAALDGLDATGADVQGVIVGSNALTRSTWPGPEDPPTSPCP